LPDGYVKADNGNPDGGLTNLVFIDGHVDKVKSALKEDPSDNSEKEWGRFEKHAWPSTRKPS